MNHQTKINRPKPIYIGHHSLSFTDRCYIMGIVNTTPDSFSDGGSFFDTSSAIEHALTLEKCGADIIDIGGESTRPGSQPISADEELHRVIPVIEALRSRTDIIISIDTYKSTVARAACKAGANIINDISGLSFDPDMLNTVAETNAVYVMMHSPSHIHDMHHAIIDGDPIEALYQYFSATMLRAENAGMARENIIIDPGIGFGKTQVQNYQILSQLWRLTELGQALLVGPSRKRFIGDIIQKPANERIYGTAATVAAAILQGANIVRVHDVDEMVDVVRISETIRAHRGDFSGQ